jgi:spermidine/putrescine transport system permease protein
MARRPFDIRAQPGFGFIALITFFALYLPIAALVAYSFNAAESLSHWQGLSLRWFVSAWQNTAVQDAAIRSLVAGGLGRRAGDDLPPPWRRWRRPAPRPYRGLTASNTPSSTSR